MTKLQTIVFLLIFLVILFSMDMIFGNPIRETFISSKNSRSNGLDKGVELNDSSNTRKNKMNDNIKGQSDDQPLHFSFPI